MTNEHEVIRISDELYNRLVKAKEELRLNSLDAALSHFLDMAEDRPFDEGKVAESMACPECRERDTDQLEIDDDDHVKCHTCGQEYDLADKKVEPVVVGVPVPLCPLIDSHCRQGECAWWDASFGSGYGQCGIMTFADGARVYARTVER